MFLYIIRLFVVQAIDTMLPFLWFKYIEFSLSTSQVTFEPRRPRRLSNINWRWCWGGSRAQGWHLIVKIQLNMYYIIRIWIGNTLHINPNIDESFWHNATEQDINLVTNTTCEKQPSIPFFADNRWQSKGVKHNSSALAGQKQRRVAKEGVNGAQTQHHTGGHTGQTSGHHLTYVALSVRPL